MNTSPTPGITLSAIVAIADDGAIGHNNALLWHITEDLRYFRKVTTGHPVIMGRKTYESIGKPLPNRTNYVISRDPHFEAPGCTVSTSLHEVIKQASNEQAVEEIFIIGGAQLYAEALPLCNKLYLTRVHHIYPHAETRFPEINFSDWQLIKRTDFAKGEAFEYPFSFEVWEKK